MRVLTVRQPWAWAIIHGGKDVENRVRNIAGNYRGPIAIHVGKQWAPEDSGTVILTPKEVAEAIRCKGHIIGVVDLVGVHEGGTAGCFPDVDDPTKLMWCSPWAILGKFHLELANPRPVEPIPYRGALGLRTITDPDVLKKLGGTSE